MPVGRRAGGLAKTRSSGRRNFLFLDDPANRPALHTTRLCNSHARLRSEVAVSSGKQFFAQQRYQLPFKLDAVAVPLPRIWEFQIRT